ncbi:hypothetical protein [Burkholderia gladioli]|uniref:hypothetical protein n=1 Tax=Burkholderia gladioli TaxID=28095 RepID=UPI0016410A59|nr:hypothetical protein [Burkholderia gladioli]
MTEFDHIDVTAKVQLGGATEGVDDEALAHEPTTLKQRVKDHAVTMTIALGCLVLGLVAVVAPLIGLYYFLKTIGLEGAANALVNWSVIGLTYGVVVIFLAMPLVSFARLVQAFHGDDQS